MVVGSLTPTKVRLNICHLSTRMGVEWWTSSSYLLIFSDVKVCTDPLEAFGEKEIIPKTLS
jgi:hypothetical protein